MKSHSVCLDILRASAAQMALWGHCVALLMIPYQLVPATRHIASAVVIHLAGYGHEAVIVFFVLSGYLIGHDSYMRIRSGTFSPGTYVVNRLVRLYCVVVPGLLLSALLDATSMRIGAGYQVIAAHGSFWPQSWLDLRSFNSNTFFCNLMFLQTAECRQFGVNSSLWSLSNEFFYYAMFPCLLLMISMRPAKTRLAAAALLGCFCVEIARAGGVHEPGRPLVYVIGLLIWVLGAFTPEIFRHLPRPVRKMPGGLLLSVIFLTLRKLEAPQEIRDVEFAMLIAWLIFNADLVDALARRLPSRARRLIATLSNYSYSLYFMHLPFLFVLMSSLGPLRRAFPYDASRICLLIGIIVLLNLLCLGFYWLFERHYRRVQRCLLPPRASELRG